MMGMAVSQMSHTAHGHRPCERPDACAQHGYAEEQPHGLADVSPKGCLILECQICMSQAAWQLFHAFPLQVH